MIASQRCVLVTDAGRPCAISILRSLGSKGWRVIAADTDPGCIGFQSRYVRQRLVYPSPLASPRAFVESLAEFVRKERVDLLVPVTDACVHPLDHARDRFAEHTRLALPAPASLAVSTDKRLTLELARELGIPVPETRVVATVDEARAAAAHLRYPLVLKPTISRRYLAAEDRIDAGSVTYARDERQLVERMGALQGRHVVLLQQFEPGVGVGVECVAQDGVVRRSFQHKRLAEIPVTGGASAWRESCPVDPELLEFTRRLVAALRWTGLLMVEFKVGQRPCLLEINGRVWGSLPLAVQAGVDFPGELAQLYFPEVVPDTSPAGYRIGLRTYNLELFLSWITQVLVLRPRHEFLPVPARRLALAGVMGLLDPAQRSDLAHAGDLLPRLSEAAHILRKATRKLTGGGRGGAA